MGVLVENIFRWLFSWIDRVVIVALNGIYTLLMKLATLNIVNMDIVTSFSKRIGLILGIFMLFNLAVNLLSYLVSPDKFSDSKQGGGKLIANVAISLILLATINTIFENAYKLQYAVLKKQIIPQIIFGTAAQDPTQDVEIAYYLFSGMISINPDVDTDGKCDEVYFKGAVSDECEDFLRPLLDDGYYNFRHAVEYKDASKLLSADNITATKKMEDGKEFVFNYFFLFSTVIGVITTFIVFNFCLDIAKRSVKLYFYQIIAPVPIIANMVPGKGTEMFKKWLKSCISTYLDVFIRLIALFFAVFIITTLYSSLSGIFAEHKLLAVFIVMGALMFAKELPQLLQDLTGIKLDGGFVINPIKKLNQVPVFGNATGAIGGAFAGGKAGAKVGNRWGGAWVGAISGMTSVPLAGTKDGKIPFASTANSVYKQMTGNDMVNFSLWKYPLNRTGKERVDEIKTARNMATSELNDLNSQLNISESMTSNVANELSKSGINVGKLDVEKNRLSIERAKLAELKSKGNDVSVDDYNNANETIQNMQAKQQELNELLKYAKQSGDANYAQELTSQIENITKDMGKAEAVKRRYEENVNMLNGIDGKLSEIDKSLSMMDKYETGMSEQNDLRSKISQVQKDIDDLNKEKRQREVFYSQDEAPQDNINALLKQTQTQDAYRARVDEKTRK